VPSLALPALGARGTDKELEQCESVRLFVDRARASHAGFALTPEHAEAVAQICTRLDGIPLAIELAAARTLTLPVTEIAARLDQSMGILTGGPRDVLPRHQTLRAALDWSWALLSHQEHVVFRRLAVFAGGCTAAYKGR
jgi:predicted ATPase